MHLVARHELIGSTAVLQLAGEIDLATAWKLSKIIREWKPAIVHAHDPHAVSMAALALSFGAPTPRPKTVASRRVDFHLQSHAFSQWKYRQVDAFIAASDAIKAILIGDGIAAEKIDVVHEIGRAHV